MRQRIIIILFGYECLLTKYKILSQIYINIIYKYIENILIVNTILYNLRLNS